MKERKTVHLILFLIIAVLVGAAWMLMSHGGRYYDEYSIRYDTVVSVSKLRSAVGDSVILPDISVGEIESFEALVGYRDDSRTSESFVVLEAYYFFPDKTYCEWKVDAKKEEYFVTRTADLSVPPEAVYCEEEDIHYTLQNDGGLSRCDVYFERDDVLYYVTMRTRGQPAEKLLDELLTRLAIR